MSYVTSFVIIIILRIKIFLSQALSILECLALDFNEKSDGANIIKLFYDIFEKKNLVWIFNIINIQSSFVNIFKYVIF